MSNFFCSGLRVVIKIILAMVLMVNRTTGLNVAVLFLAPLGNLTLPTDTVGFWVIRTTNQLERGRGAVRYINGRWYFANIFIEYDFSEHEMLQFAIFTKNGEEESQIGLLECRLGSIPGIGIKRNTELKLEDGKGRLKISGQVFVPKLIEVSFKSTDKDKGICNGISDPSLEILKESTSEEARFEALDVSVSVEELKFSLPEKSMLGKLGEIFKCDVYRENCSEFVGSIKFTLADVFMGTNALGVDLDFNTINTNPVKVIMSSKIKELTLDPILGIFRDSTPLRFGLGVQGTTGFSLLTNENTKLVTAVAEAVQDYSRTTAFPAIMFGTGNGGGNCKLVSAISSTGKTCRSINEAAREYQNRILNAASYSPWTKAGIFDAFDEFASIACNGDKIGKGYFVFLILIDQDISDADMSTEYILNPDTGEKGSASNFIEVIQHNPMSLIIVGIGPDSRFPNLKRFCTENFFTRKLLQFICLNELSNLHLSDEQVARAESLLIKKCLCEIPNQVSEWHAKNKPA